MKNNFFNIQYSREKRKKFFNILECWILAGFLTVSKLKYFKYYLNLTIITILLNLKKTNLPPFSDTVI